MKKLALLALLLAPSLALSAVTAVTTPGDWALYRGTSILSRHATEAACVDRAKALNVTRSYTCRTSTGVAVTVTADPPPPPPVDCVVSAWSGWVETGRTTSASVITITEQRTRTVTTAAANGGAACPALVESRTRTEAVQPPPPPPPTSGASYLLDDFEGAAIVAVQPMSPATRRYQWDMVEGVGTGVTSLTTADKFSGAQSLRSVFTGGDWQFHFFTYTEGMAGYRDGWHFVREFAPGWQTGKVNRLKFWIKLPPGIKSYKDGQMNFHFGTFTRCPTCTESESDNGHFYHYYNFETTGQWEQVIVDTNPHHQRSGNASAEIGDKAQMFPGATYFDSMVRFYLDMPWNQGGVANNSAFLMDRFEFYEETRPENIAQVYSIHGTFVPGENRVHVGWSHKKNETTVKHDVRYAFTDIYTNGWDAATPAGSVTPGTEPGYNTMLWNGVGLPTAGKSVIYIAIKPQNATTFRQIEIPLQ